MRFRRELSNDMSKSRIAAVASIGLFLLATSVVHADVKTSEKSTFKLASVNGPSWPHPAIHDGKLYVRDQNVLMCYELK